MISELLELREDEKMALQSIYGDAFIEKIPNKGKHTKDIILNS